MVRFSDSNEHVVPHDAAPPALKSFKPTSELTGISPSNLPGRKALLEALRESNELYRTVVESAGEVIAAVHKDGTLFFVNSICSERLDGRPEDFIGKNMRDIFPLEQAERLMGVHTQVIETGQGVDVTEALNIREARRWYHATIMPLKPVKGPCSSVVVIARDIHDYRMAQEQLVMYREHMASAERYVSMGTLSATLVHKLTQPLTALGLSLENALYELKSVPDSGFAAESLRDGLEMISEITGIVDQVRVFARHSSKYSLEPTDIGAGVDRVIWYCSGSAGRSNVTVANEGLDSLPPVLIDTRDFEQLLFALVDNSIRSADGQDAHEVAITGRVADDCVVLSVADDCGGISPEFTDRIFDPFFTTRNPGEGTGLGLSVVEDILWRVRGKVRVENRPGEGATFHIELPIAPSRKDPE